MEILLVQKERAVLINRHQVAGDLFPESKELRRLFITIGRQAHQLIFAGIDLESAIVGGSRIQQPKRVWIPDLFEAAYFFPTPLPDHRSGPLPYTIDRQDSSLFVRGDIEGARRMGQVMFA